MSMDLRHAIASTRTGDDELGEAVVVGYVVVAEWMTPEGVKWLSLDTGDAGGQPLERWQYQGFLHNVLHDPTWQTGDDEDDE